MKKKTGTIIFGIIAVIAAGITVFKILSSNQTTDYILCNNENQVFDGVFSNESTRTFAIPQQSPSLSFSDEQLDAIRSVKDVEGIFPYYPLIVKGGEDSMNEDELYIPLNTEIIYHQTHMSGSFTIPLKQNLSNTNSSEDLSEYDIFNLYIKPYISENSFYQAMKSNDVILKTFDTKSGIFISERLYKEMQLDESDNHLSIEVPVSVPLYAKRTPAVMEYRINGERKEQAYEALEITDYAIVKVTLDIEGVLKSNNVSVHFCDEQNIVMPYEMTKEIYEMADRQQYSKNDAQDYWEPNSYIIQCKNGSNIDKVGTKINKVINDFIIQIYSYDKENSLTKRLYR